MKKLMIFAATAAVALSSCSKTEVVTDANDNIPNNPNAIAFASNTTRASVNDLTDVQTGFEVYAKSSTDDSDWYNGAKFYLQPTTAEGSVSNYNGWQWASDLATPTIVEAPTWPTASTWQMDFYAAYPTGLTNNTYPNVTKLITIAADRFDQIDHLAAKATATAKPAGALPLNFKHILSRINMMVTAGTGMVAQVQGASIVNVGMNSGTYDYVTETMANGTAADATYLFHETAFAGSQEVTTNSWKAPLTAANTLNLLQTNGTDNGYLMFIPQTVKPITNGGTSIADLAAFNALTAATRNGAFANGTYIELLYRLDDGAGNDIVGRGDITTGTLYDVNGLVTPNPAAGDVYAAAPPTADDTNPDNDGSYANDGKIAAGDNLYIKVRFPISFATSTWAQGTAYLYNLLLGGEGAGGYYADDVLYDEAGNPSGYYHHGEPGEEVFTNKIHFNVTVTGWGTETDLPLNEINP